MFVVRRYSREGGANIVFEKEGAHTTTCARVTSENYYYRYLKGNDGKSCIWATIPIRKVSVDDLDIPWRWNYNGMKEKEKKGSSNEYKRVKGRLFRRKIFPFDSYYFRIWFNYCTNSSERKKQQRIHSRMIERKMYREDVGELSRNSTLLFPRNGGRKKNLKSASSSRPPPPLESRRFRLHRKEWAWRNRSSDKFLRQGLNREKILSTYASDRFYLRFRTFLFPPFLSPTLSLAPLQRFYILYIYIFYTEERLNSGGFYIR